MSIDIDNGVGSDTKKRLEDIGKIQLDSTESDCVLIRWIQPEVESLPILTYAVSDVVPKLTKGIFSIPELKEFSEYGDEDDPTCGQGIVTLHGDYERRLLKKHPEAGEQAFIKWFAEKAWFPVRANGHKFLITLLRKESIPYTAPEIDNALFDFECALAKVESNQTDAHYGIDSVAQWLNTEKNVNYQNASLMLAYILVSNNGLGWNRVWIFQEGSSDNNSMTWKCHVALGHTCKGDWSQALAFISDLKEETDSIPTSTLSEMDQLYHHCTGKFEWMVEKQFILCLEPNISPDKEFYPILSHNRTLTSRFSTAVRDHIGDEYDVGNEFGNENDMAPVWFLQMNLRQEKILIALSDAYTIERVPPVMETTAVLRWMQHVLPNWLARDTGICSEDDIEAEVNERF